jgi:hypothetical protein
LHHRYGAFFAGHMIGKVAQMIPKIQEALEFMRLFRSIWIAARRIQKAGIKVKSVDFMSPTEQSVSDLYWRQRIFSNKADRGES